MPVSASLGVVSTVSACVGGILLLTSKKYKKKLLKYCELIVKITSSLATFEVLISLSLNDDSVIDAKEFHKLQTLYLQAMADVRKCRQKNESPNGRKFSKKNYSGRNKESKKRHGTKIVGFSICLLFNCLHYKDNKE